MGALFVPLFLLAALPGWPADLLQGYRSESGPWGTVYHKGWNQADRGRMSREIADALAGVEARIGRRRGRPFQAVLAPDQREFARIYRSLTDRRPESWIAGVAFPGHDLLLVRGDSFSVLKPPAERPTAVLEHELAHLVIHAEEVEAIPRWFDEGVAMWASRRALEPDDEAFLSGLARLGALKDLKALDRQMPQSHDLASIAYEESLLAVQWLVGRFGPAAIGDLLDRMEKGSPFEDALLGRTGLSMADFQVEFLRWLQGKRSLWEVVASMVSLWTAVSLLALLAIARAAVRRRRLLRQMEEKEREEALDPYSPDVP